MSLPVSCLHPDKSGRQAHQVVGDLRQGLGVVARNPGLVRQGHGGDAALGAGRQQAGQDVHQAQGVVEALGGPPVRGEDALLHRLPRQGPVRKAVQGEDVEIMLGQKVLKPGQMIPGQQLPAFRIGEAQTQAEGPLRGEPGLEPRHQGLEILK